MKFRHHRLVFYSTWIFLALMQSSLTELQDDEAYYWVYSKFPAWGYFDHPPVTAILIKAGYFFFHNELGVRLFFVLFNLLTLLLIEKLTEKRNSFIFYLIALSLPVLQLGGFMAVPDVPLVCFTALFFLVLRNYFRENSWKNVIYLGVAIALLFYTKYHGVIVVIPALLSCPTIFRDGRLYVAGTIALLLFLPHLAWQYEHHWISFRYHLFESNVDPYRLSYTTNYFAGQLLLAGTIASLVLLPAAFLCMAKTPTEKALKWMMYTMYAFFFISSFRGKVEPNWTMPVIVPLMVLSHQYLVERRGWLRWLWRTVPVTILLVLFARIIMISDILAVESVKSRFHAWNAWPQEMKRITGGLPVIFSNSYQRASKYWFYSGQVTYSQNHVRDHRNNYDLWPIEDSLLGKPVYFLDTYGLDRFPETFKTPIGLIGYRYDSSFQSFARISFKPNTNRLELHRSDTLRMSIQAQMPEKYFDYLRLHSGVRAVIKLYVLQRKNILLDVILPNRLDTSIITPFDIRIPVNLPPGKYRAMFSIESEGYNPTHNSDPIIIKVSE